MKRFHVHLSVQDLAASLRFYTQLFGQPPSVEKPDYAKWLLDEPRVNFAISQRGAPVGLNHLGFQLDSDEALAAQRAQADQAGIAALDEPAAACCYARSDKYWVRDPQGIAWETFHTLGDIPVFGESPAATSSTQRDCCAPSAPPASTGKACCG